MKRLLSMVLLLAVVLSVVASLASCGAPKDDGAQISVYLGEGVYDLDPSDYYVSDNAAQLMSLIYEPLFRITEKGKLECAAADDYEVDEETRTISITLKETYWSDGNRVKAEDFVYAWRDVILSPNNANAAAPLLYDIENAVEIKNGAPINSFGVVPRVYDLEITYREGADYKQLLRNLACVATAPVRQDVANLAPGHWSKSADTIVTNGPLMVRSLKYPITDLEKTDIEADDGEVSEERLLPGSLTLERNKGYHQSPNKKDYDNEVRPYRLNATFTVGDAEVTIGYEALQNNTVFYLGDASLAQRAANKKNAVVSDLASTYTYVFNSNKAPFNNPNVRYALSIALNRQAIVDAVVFGKPATALVGDVSSETIDGTQKLLATGDDMTKAQELIAAANIPAADMKITLAVNADEESLKIAELAEQAWEALDFDVEVVSESYIESNVVDKTSTTGYAYVRDDALQYLVKGIAQYGWNEFAPGIDIIGIDLQTYSDDAFVALSSFSNTMNGNGVSFEGDTNNVVVKGVLGGWNNSEYNKLIEEAYAAKDSGVREEKLKAAEKLLIEQAPVIPVIFNQSFAFVSKQLKKVETNGYGYFEFTSAKLKNYEDYLPKA
ncbi:MAG: hypothetical protein IKV16_01700 [Clostridia bacterium]|nr:hypothetical protein [Clostridia bacterium]